MRKRNHTGSSIWGRLAQQYHGKRQNVRSPAPWLPFIIDGLTVRYDSRGAIGTHSGRVLREWKVFGKELQ